MNKVDAMNTLINISDECESANKCTRCAFYNLAEHMEGCVFDRLVHEINPMDFKQILKSKSGTI